MNGADPGFYDDAFAFWRLLAETSVPFGKTKALLNETAPIILANAFWYPDSESVPELDTFYAEQGIRGSCFLDTLRDPDLLITLSLTNANFSRTAQYTFIPVLGRQPASLPVEQVSWSQGRALAEVIAQRDDLTEYAVVTGQALALAMQLEPMLSAYIAYNETPVGTMIVFETRARLLAMSLEPLTPDAETSLQARLVLEGETRNQPAYLFAQSEDGWLELWQ